MLSIKHNKLFSKWSLQAQVFIFMQKRKRASCFGSCKGSATIETALVFPLFLCAVCALIMAGQFLMTEAKIQYAVSKTAEIYAVRKAVAERDLREVNSHLVKHAMQNISVQAIFSSVYFPSKIDKNCIQGGASGVLVTASSLDDGRELVRINAAYRLKVSVPFFPGFSFLKKNSAVQRVFSGYVEEGESGIDEGGKRLVYVTKYGEVYHTRLSCTHISRRISGGEVKQIMREGKYKPCERCMKGGRAPDVLYVTFYGDKYHASMGCSGLKRMIRTVKLNEVKGRKKCSRCGN